MKKRILCSIIAMIMCLNVLSIGIYAVDEVASGGHLYMSWVLTNDGVLTIEGSEVPSSEAGGAPWYQYRDQIAKIIIKTNGSNNVIGDYAFYNLDNLKVVELYGNGIESVGVSAFENCDNLSKIYLWGRNGDLVIGKKAFYNCVKLKEISISANSEIASYAFSGCNSLENIYITPLPLQKMNSMTMW